MDIQAYLNKDYDRSRPFHVVAPYEPMGDQPEAIASLSPVPQGAMHTATSVFIRNSSFSVELSLMNSL